MREEKKERNPRDKAEKKITQTTADSVAATTNGENLIAVTMQHRWYARRAFESNKCANAWPRTLLSDLIHFSSVLTQFHHHIQPPVTSPGLFFFWFFSCFVILFLCIRWALLFSAFCLIPVYVICMFFSCHFLFLPCTCAHRAIYIHTHFAFMFVWFEKDIVTSWCAF